MRIHVVGAGLAGLAAAWRLAEDGFAVTLYEAAPQAGGRCRSFFDERLGCVLDNGGHVMLGANANARDFLTGTGGLAEMIEIAPAAVPFLDLRTGETWALRPNGGPVPWWIFSPSRRVPHTTARDYLALRKLFAATNNATVGECIDTNSMLGTALITPMAIAVMNADPSVAAAEPFARMLQGTLLRGESACRPWLARRSLTAAFVEPALRRLAAHGGDFRPGWRLARIEIGDQNIRALRFDEERVALGDDRVVLAIPPHVATDVLPALQAPEGANGIVNAHFRLGKSVSLPGGKPLLGLTGALAQWLIVRDDIVSVTVSAADDLLDRPAEMLLAALWSDVARTTGLETTPMPPARLIKERRATFAQTSANQRRRPATRTAWANLFLAGDWTATGLPATIESAVTSGFAAARAVVGS